jgi:hypothetical protein
MGMKKILIHKSHKHLRPTLALNKQKTPIEKSMNMLAILFSGPVFQHSSPHFPTSRISLKVIFPEGDTFFFRF